MALLLPVQDLDRLHNVANAGMSNAFPDSRRIISCSKAKKQIPWLTPAITVINTFVYAVVMFINNCPKTPAGQEGKCVPKFCGRFSYDKTTYGPSEKTLLKLGAVLGNTIDHEKLKLFVSFWLHKNIFHLIVNLMSLLIVGIPLEQEFGLDLEGPFSTLSLCLKFKPYALQAPCSDGLIDATLSELLTNLLSYENKVVNGS